MKAPHTVFSTELRGGKSLLKARLGDLLAPGIKRGGGGLLGLALCLTLLLGALVSCRQEAAQPDPDALAETALDQVLDYRDERESWNLLWETPAGEDTVYAFSYDGGPHAAGLGNLLLLAADGTTGELTGTPVLLPGDQCAALSWPADDGLHVLCTTVTTYQGVDTCGGGEVVYADGTWTWTWPAAPGSPDYQSYWADRKGVITLGNLDLYIRGDWDPATALGTEPQWIYADTRLFREENPAVGMARAYVSQILPAEVADNADFQITGLTLTGTYDDADTGRTVEAWTLTYTYEDWDSGSQAESPEGLHIYLCYPTGNPHPTLTFLLGSSTDTDTERAAWRLNHRRYYPLEEEPLPDTDLPFWGFKLEDIRAALRDAMNDFAWDFTRFPHKIWFDPVASGRRREEYLLSTDYEAAREDVMPLFCDWTPQDMPLNEALYHDWPILLLRQGETWTVVDWGDRLLTPLASPAAE